MIIELFAVINHDVIATEDVRAFFEGFPNAYCIVSYNK